jgi:hypothetical protein
VGDHHVVVGRVTALGETSGGRPLLFHRGRYTVIEPLRGTWRKSWPGCGPTTGCRSYFQRKWTNTRPKLSESFSTRWYSALISF